MRTLRTREYDKWKKLGGFLLLLLLFIVLLNSVRKVYKKKSASEQALVRMEADVENLEARKEFLENSIERLKTEEGLKFEIKKKLNVAEAGEAVAIIIDESEATTPDSSSPSFWQKIKDLFR